MKYFFIIFFFFININFSYSAQKDKAYFAGGCFWCVEESFEKLKGVEEVISGYSGGITENPTYKEVTYGNTGHFEVVEIIYDKKVISFEKLLKNFWVNIDPFDAYGQFCDKGYSYRSVAFYQNDEEKKLIEKDIKDLQNKFNKKVVTYIRNFEKFYKAEEYHQDFYKIKLERYLRYKKACGREELLKRIWSQ
ncbi:peptide-methionine (S)-S-oxide reductase MsrA [Candidatus Pelagibacter sp.]|uniref:peptide-methionine (S)-S-oxide reductase MsrA n=1 Tax=Candidatus Pelagibacter sp. TaxID=2024849 RepID=UPI003F83F38F